MLNNIEEKTPLFWVASYSPFPPEKKKPMILKSNLVDTHGILAFGGQVLFQTLEHVVRCPALTKEVVHSCVSKKHSVFLRSSELFYSNAH